MKSEMDRVPEGYVGLDIYGAYIKGNEFILLGNPDEQDNHNCDAMGCGSLDHVLIRCEIPEWQAAQHLRAPDEATGCAHRVVHPAGSDSVICDDCGKTLRR